jgi:hypothetical protein
MVPRELGEIPYFIKMIERLGGERGIRTLVRVSPKHAFQACAFSHSAISPATVYALSIVNAPNDPLRRSRATGPRKPVRSSSRWRPSATGRWGIDPRRCRAPASPSQIVRRGPSDACARESVESPGPLPPTQFRRWPRKSVCSRMRRFCAPPARLRRFPSVSRPRWRRRNRASSLAEGTHPAQPCSVRRRPRGRRKLPGPVRPEGTPAGRVL